MRSNNRWRSAMLAMAALAIAGMGAADAQASYPWGYCPPPCPQPCGQVVYQDVQRTVYVPQTTYETRSVQCVQYQPQVTERVVTVPKRVPYMETVSCNYTVMVPEVHTKMVTETVCKPVYSTETQEYTVMVPSQEVRQGTKQVCQKVAVQETRTVCRDEGSWEERCYTSCCNGCTRTYTCKVWVPNIVKEEVPVTVYKTQMVDEPYEYTVTVCKPEVRTRQVQRCQMVNEQQQREVQYTVCKPEVRTREYQVTRYRCEMEQKSIPCTVMVPQTVERQVQVPVCRLVAKTVTCKVPTWVPTCPTGNCP